jgi:ribonuclease P protein component
LEAPRVQLLAVPAAESIGRVGYVIGSKQIPRAVDRNRLKRMFREALRTRGERTSRFDIVLRLRRSCGAAELREVVAEATSLLDALDAGR